LEYWVKWEGKGMGIRAILGNLLSISGNVPAAGAVSPEREIVESLLEPQAGACGIGSGRLSFAGFSSSPA
jgi:hypothetical protein